MVGPLVTRWSTTHICNTADGEVRRCSVVDSACVPTALYPLVQHFSVLPFQLSTSKDHSALYVSLRGLESSTSAFLGGLGSHGFSALRDSGCATQLVARQGVFSAMLRAWQVGNIPVQHALQQFSDLLVECAREGLWAPLQPPQPPLVRTSHGMTQSARPWQR
jgi:hypothetical protein